MRIQRILIALTFLNLGLLVFLLAHVRPVEANSGAPVLRGSALEIVDDQGRVRASIKLHPEDPAVKMPNGKPYPETVMFRLIDREGRPEVKLGASADGGGLGLVGDTDATQILLKAEGAEAMLKLTDRGGRQQLVKP